MQTEIEAKFLDCDHTWLRKQLQAAGAQCVRPERLMRRQNYDLPQSDPGIWIRVRDEGGTVTMSYKHMQDRTLHGTKEICLTIDNYEQGDAFARAVGLVPSGYQETKRETWRLGLVDIELDTWPWIPPYCEVEGPNEASVVAVVEKLGLTMSQAVHGGIDIAYTTVYDIPESAINSTPRITFDMPVPDWLEAKRR